MKDIKLNTIPEAIAAVKKGEMIIVVDDEDRENEGDIIVASELVTPEIIELRINGMITIFKEVKNISPIQATYFTPCGTK